MVNASKKRQTLKIAPKTYVSATGSTCMKSNLLVEPKEMYLHPIDQLKNLYHTLPNKLPLIPNALLKMLHLVTTSISMGVLVYAMKQDVNSSFTILMMVNAFKNLPTTEVAPPVISLKVNITCFIGTDLAMVVDFKMQPLTHQQTQHPLTHQQILQPLTHQLTQQISVKQL